MNDSTFIVHSPAPNVPIMLKKLVSENGEKQRCLKSLLNESPNRHTSPVSDGQPLGQFKTKSPEHLQTVSGTGLGCTIETNVKKKSLGGGI